MNCSKFGQKTNGFIYLFVLYHIQTMHELISFIEYYRLLGVTHITIFDNSCTRILYDEQIQGYVQEGIVRIENMLKCIHLPHDLISKTAFNWTNKNIDYFGAGGIMQYIIQKTAHLQPPKHSLVMTLDMDEYIQVDDLNEVRKNMIQNRNCIQILLWKVFGNSGNYRQIDSIFGYTMRAPTRGEFENSFNKKRIQEIRRSLVKDDAMFCRNSFMFGKPIFLWSSDVFCYTHTCRIPPRCYRPRFINETIFLAHFYTKSTSEWLNRGKRTSGRCNVQAGIPKIYNYIEDTSVQDRIKRLISMQTLSYSKCLNNLFMLSNISNYSQIVAKNEHCRMLIALHGESSHRVKDAVYSLQKNALPYVCSKRYVFVHTFAPQKIINEVRSELLKLHPVKLIVENKTDFHFKISRTDIDKYNLFREKYSMTRVLSMINMKNPKYEFILSVSLNMCIDSKIISWKPLPYIQVPNWGHKNGINDRFAIGPKYVMMKFMEAFAKIDSYMNQSEQTLCNFCIANKLKVGAIAVWMSRLDTHLDLFQTPHTPLMCINLGLLYHNSEQDYKSPIVNANFKFSSQTRFNARIFYSPVRVYREIAPWRE